MKRPQKHTGMHSWKRFHAFLELQRELIHSQVLIFSGKHHKWISTGRRGRTDSLLPSSNVPHSLCVFSCAYLCMCIFPCSPVLLSQEAKDLLFRMASSYRCSCTPKAEHARVRREDRKEDGRRNKQGVKSQETEEKKLKFYLILLKSWVHTI